jgi:hypothetical protein
MMPALLLDTRNCTLRPCWPPADSVNTCVAMPDRSAITTQGPKFSPGKLLAARSRHPSCSCYEAIPVALPPPFKTHPLEPAAKSP